jgi:aryl-alcohol dehydrogenase-like predicted oxidoreductase
MRTKAFGSTGLQISEMGLGCMGMSEFYGAGDEAESLRTIDRALELGINFLDTADMYGRGANEELLGRALRGRRERVFLATKFGIVRSDDPTARSISGKPEYVRASCDASLRRLGIDVIDLYYLHRVDPDTPIEDTIGAMAQLVYAGKVRYLGLSEASAATIERACRVFPVAALQTEYSLFSRDVEDDGTLEAARKYGMAFVAYSPLGRGFLSGKIRSLEDLAPGDFRRFSPRFAGENFAKNLALVDRVKALAEQLGVTPSQLALAWVLAKGEDIFPIPGTKRVAYLEEDAAAAQVGLGADHLAQLEEVAPKGAVAGDRYADMRFVNA